uniref:Uncharacterized protein n=1 Tax=Physcomitrium patens TaxID=3218 RepID=A0A7I4AUD0_PHYPA
MGESVDLFEDLRERNNEKGHGSSVEPVEPAEPAVPSAPPAHDHVDLEAPLLGDPSQRYGSNQAIEGQIPPLPPPVLEPLPPEGDPLLYVCRILSIVTAVGALLCLLVNAISLFRSFDYRGFDYRVSVFVGILRCYTIAIAILVILAETEWEALFNFWKKTPINAWSALFSEMFRKSYTRRSFLQMLEFWIGRGLLQILVAALTRVLKRSSGETGAESLLHELASWWLFGCGIVYTVAGFLCLGSIKRNHLKRQNWRKKAQKDLEELHRRRADLEGQLSKQ